MGDCTRVSRWCAVVFTWLASEWANGHARIWRVCSIDRAHACICVRDSASVCVRLHVCLRVLGRTCLCECVRARARVRQSVCALPSGKTMPSKLPRRGPAPPRRAPCASPRTRARAVRAVSPCPPVRPRCNMQRATCNTQRAAGANMGRPSPGADVAGASPVLRQMWQRWLGSDTSCSRITSAISVGECRAWRKHSELRLRSHRASPGRRYHRLISAYVRTGYA
jgi:hypothetical protein